MAQTSGLFTSGGQTSALTPLLLGHKNPVHVGIISDLGLGHINHDNLVVLVGGVLGNPVAVQYSQALQPVTNPLLGNSLEVSVWLLLVDSTRSLGLTVSAT